MSKKGLFIRRQHRVLLYVLIVSFLLGLGAELIVGAPLGNILAMTIGGLTGIILIAIFHYRDIFPQSIPYIAILAITVIAFIVMLSSDYVTNILFIFYLFPVAAMALSHPVFITSGFLGGALFLYFVFVKGDAAGIDGRATAIIFVFLSLVYLVLYFFVKNTGKLFIDLENALSDSERTSNELKEQRALITAGVETVQERTEEVKTSWGKKPNGDESNA
jgi:methyl-accepting chemotaxis protein